MTIMPKKIYNIILVGFRYYIVVQKCIIMLFNIIFRNLATSCYYIISQYQSTVDQCE